MEGQHLPKTLRQMCMPDELVPPHTGRREGLGSHSLSPRPALALGKPRQLLEPKMGGPWEKSDLHGVAGDRRRGTGTGPSRPCPSLCTARHPTLGKTSHHQGIRAWCVLAPTLRGWA